MPGCKRKEIMHSEYRMRGALWLTFLLFQDEKHGWLNFFDDTHPDCPVMHTPTLAGIQETFSIFDKDNDGLIANALVGPVLRSIGYNPSENEINELLEKYDPEGDGMVEFGTFVELMSQVKRQGESSEDIEAAFRAFDHGSSGCVEVAELREMLTTRGEKLTEDEADEFLAFADPNGKGEVNYREVTKLLLREKVVDTYFP
ncbi:hypothetical protein CAPTEDRAFT_202961 [Capitella teleta]|uniref:EF-hand domain-containing protein n=1 Tax=Capitella teleta TaxID=283909 RepID=R7VG49_CAPTE|nr:hypothetical protein CAPTEDRAFT_202961 [Capitella teleta]|eukprot:ELU17547.1 hypothetical protein CAPTEDRAFT_202961 [Capitella teleta]